jgi:hypothetical protein
MALAAVAPSASAAFGLKSFDLNFAQEDGSPALKAGSHPFAVTTAFSVNTILSGGLERPDEAIKDLEIELPLGLVGIPKGVPQCSGANFAEVDISSVPQMPNCSNDSAIGFVNVQTRFDPAPPGGLTNAGVPLWNLKPAPGSVAKFGFVVLSVPVTLEAKLSEEAPYRVVATVRNAPQPLLLFGSSVTIWGDPASSVHDTARGSCFKGIAEDGSFESNGSCPFDPATPHQAFLTLPRACLGPLATSYSADSWETPQTKAMGSIDSAGFGGCGELEFEPRIGATTSSKSAESPTGLNFSVDVDAEGISSAAKRAQSDLQKIVATLPKGVTINPSAGDGLLGCTTAQLESEKLSSAPGEGCPEASKVGTVSVTSPLVDEEIDGSLFVGQPDDPATTTPGLENPFDSFLSVYLVLRNQNLGVLIKQAGKVDADRETGQLTATFEDLPQIPFSHLVAHFREGPRAPLVTPGQCGAYVAEAVQTPRANPGEPRTVTANFEITSGAGASACPGAAPAPLHPGFAGGTVTTKAGSFSPLNLHLTRQDGEAELIRFAGRLPPGLTAKLAGVARCPDAAIEAARGKSGRQELANPSCPASSEIGHVLAGAGAGPALTYVSGKIYLAGSFGGDPLSVVIITPAVAGPFDVGNVVVRVGLLPDASTAEVKIDDSHTAAIPRILRGIPLRLRDLRVSVDRANFALNPTSCEPQSLRATATGAGPALDSSLETVAQLAVRFQASDCGSLGFKPSLFLSLTGATKRTGHPALRAVLKPRPGDANIGRIGVVLPPSQFVDPTRIANPCTRPQFAQGACPSDSVLGYARAFTPLLDNPLEGPVYFRSNGGERDLPDIVADLNGEIHIVAVGYVDAVHHQGSEASRLRNVFAIVPDAPVSKIVLSLKGGKEGLLQNSRNLCAEPPRAIVRVSGHNGRTENFGPLIKTSCRKKP